MSETTDPAAPAEGATDPAATGGAIDPAEAAAAAAAAAPAADQAEPTPAPAAAPAEPEFDPAQEEKPHGSYIEERLAAIEAHLGIGQGADQAKEEN